MKNKGFRNYYKNAANKISLEINAYLSLWIKNNIHISPRLGPLLTALGEGAKGGKRIRGMLVILGYSLALQKSLTSKEEKTILQVAVAYEIFQTAILAHDDIIDKSELRRGIRTLHHHLGGNHYGISQTISLGDLGFFIAYKIMAEIQFSEHLKTKALAFFSDSLTKTVLGQMLDVEFSHKKFALSENLLQEIVQMYKLKTAYYTFIAPLSLGAILAGADETFLASIKVFGENVGVLFQLQDDLSDIFDNSKDTKKDSGADIKEGKITLLYAKAMQNANTTQRNILDKYYGKALTDKKTLSEIQKVFIQTNARTYIQTMIEKYEHDARTVIPAITKKKNEQQMLHEIIDYVCGKEING
ncbi:MAG: polyprenyl synthetase family protein [Candidatus Levyibacteriota bacterium]